MKRTLILIFALTFCLFANSPSYSVETNSSDYQIVNDNSITEEDNANYNVKQETDKLLFIEKNNKLGIIDKTTGEYVLEPIADSISRFKENNDTEYKIRINNNTGYLNTDKKIIFISNYDDIYLSDNYIKVKKDNKYGFFNKMGNPVLKPVFDEVGIIKNDTNEYLTGKYNGEVKFFDKNGKYISENELYIVKEDNNIILVRDLKPIIKKYRRKNGAMYETPDTVEIGHIPLRDKPHTAFVEKNIKNHFDEPSEDTIISIKNKNYILLKNKGKIGLSKENGKEVIPALYDSIDAKNLCKHFSSPVIIAKKHNSLSIYDLKGKMLAEEVYNKINIYKYGKIYSYQFEAGKWILKENNKIIGNITINDDGSYEFVKTKFHLRSLHKINELLITMLTTA